jgi:hypothetical protein
MGGPEKQYYAEQKCCNPKLSSKNLKWFSICFVCSQFAMHAEEVKALCEKFVNSIGHKFDEDEFSRVTESTEYFSFPMVLEFIETRYGVCVEEGGSKEAVQELYETYALDVLKKVSFT